MCAPIKHVVHYIGSFDCRVTCLTFLVTNTISFIMLLFWRENFPKIFSSKIVVPGSHLQLVFRVKCNKFALEKAHENVSTNLAVTSTKVQGLSSDIFKVSQEAISLWEQHCMTRMPSVFFAACVIIHFNRRMSDKCDVLFCPM